MKKNKISISISIGNRDGRSAAGIADRRNGLESAEPRRIWGGKRDFSPFVGVGELGEGGDQSVSGWNAGFWFDDEIWFSAYIMQPKKRECLEREREKEERENRRLQQRQWRPE